MPRATPPKGQEKSCPTLDERLTCVTQICVDALRTHLSCPGKTLIAVMLVAANLRNQQALGTSAAAPALLLVHMRALQLHVLRELKSELAGEAQETNVCKGMVRLKLRGGAEAFVATVDALSSELVANEKAQSEDEVAASLRKVWAGVLTTVRSRAIWPVGHRQSRLVGAVGSGTGRGRS